MLICRQITWKSLETVQYRTFSHGIFGRKSCILYGVKFHPSNINRLISKLPLLLKIFVSSKMKNFQRHVENPVEHITWSLKAPSFRCLTGFCLRLWLVFKLFTITSSLSSCRKKLSNYFNYQEQNKCKMGAFLMVDLILNAKKYVYLYP